MKHLLKNTMLFLFALSLFSCSKKEDNLNSLENRPLHFEEFFEKVSSMDLKTSQENIIYIDYNWDPTNKTMELLKTEEKEPDFFILESDKTIAARIAKDDYQVECDRGGDGKDDWSKDCDGKWSCGKLIAKCLDEGGCATICKQRLAYSPQTRTFYLGLNE